MSNKGRIIAAVIIVAAAGIGLCSSYSSLNQGRLSPLNSFIRGQRSLPVISVSQPCGVPNGTVIRQGALNQTRPYIISNPGVYCFEENITVNKGPGTDIITIAASDVTLDFAGHSMTNTDGFNFADGFGFPQTRSPFFKAINIAAHPQVGSAMILLRNIAIKNGTLKGFETGIGGSGVKKVSIEKMSVEKSGVGVFMGDVENVSVANSTFLDVFTGIQLTAPLNTNNEYFDVNSNQIILKSGNYRPMPLAGISIIGAPKVSINKNTITVAYTSNFLPGSGILANGISTLQISGNEIGGQSLYGIDVSFSGRATIENNTMVTKLGTALVPNSGVRNRDNTDIKITNNMSRYYQQAILFDNTSALYRGNVACQAQTIVNIINSPATVVDGGGNQLNGPSC